MSKQRFWQKLFVFLSLLALLGGLVSCGQEESVPRAWIDWPRDGASLPVHTSVLVASRAYAREGVAEVLLSVNGEPYRRDGPAETGATYIAVTQEWRPEREGVYTLQITTFAANGKTSDPAIVSVTVVGAVAQIPSPPAPSPTPTWTPIIPVPVTPTVTSTPTSTTIPPRPVTPTAVDVGPAVGETTVPEPSAVSPPAGGSKPGALVQPEELTYLGAFRLPDGPPEIGWEYSGAALAYYPNGDPYGPDDGFPGSLFGTGHDWNQYVSEISIPVPVISAGKNVEELNTAATLQEFRDIKGGLLGYLEVPRAGLEYVPAQGAQTGGKLYFAWAQHMGEGETNPSHGWSELDLSNPQTAGLWRIGEYPNYVTGDYLFAIPQAWGEAHTPGMYLATGRFRDGGQGAKGPTLFAIGPWNEGNPPPPGSTLPGVPLLLYGNVYEENTPAVRGYHHSDEWSGGAWLTAGDRSAVIFVGTKGQGNCWYGFANGVVWPDEPPYPTVPAPPFDERGWWSDRFVGQILFYDPAHLAAVARGAMATHEPQPYATLEIDEYLYHVESEQQWHHVGAASFDRERGLLYVFETFGDGDKPLVHVWRVEG